MMSTSTGRSRFPFTANQWQELEHQALIYKYMVAGMPVPADLLYTIRRSLDSSLSSKLIMHQPHHRTIHHIICVFLCLFWDYLVILIFGCSWMELFSDGIWEENRSRAREVQKNRWKEVEMFKRSLPRFQVLWETHAQRQKPFKKACGNYDYN